MHVFLIILFALLCFAWVILRMFMRTRKLYPLSLTGSLIAGTLAWILLLASIIWISIIVLMLWNISFSYAVQDLILLVLTLIVSVIIIVVFMQYKYELQLDETIDFIKDSLRFRRSKKSRLDVISSMKNSQQKREARIGIKSDTAERIKLEAELNKEKEIKENLVLLKQGNTVDISKIWLANSERHVQESIYTKINEVRVEPNRKRLSMIADFPDLNGAKLQDEMYVLKFNRDVYDFLQSLRYENWLKRYMPFFEIFFLICRTLKLNEDGDQIFYPFMKVEILISDLVKLEGKYFNPRKLGEIAALEFNRGNPV